LTPHFGVAATSPPFSASAKLAVVMAKKTAHQARPALAAADLPRRPVRQLLTASLSAFPPLGLWASVVKSLSAIPHSALRTLRIPPSALGQPLDNQARSSPIVPDKANLYIHQSLNPLLHQSLNPVIHSSTNPSCWFICVHL